MEPERISPEEANRRIKEQNAMFVCAYPDEEKCRRMKLKGAISLTQLESQLPSIEKNQEIVFYCA